MKTTAQIRSQRTGHASTRSFFRYAISHLATLAVLGLGLGLAAGLMACSQSMHAADENQPPVIAELPDQQVDASATLALPVVVTDPDGHGL